MIYLKKLFWVVYLEKMMIVDRSFEIEKIYILNVYKASI